MWIGLAMGILKVVVPETWAGSLGWAIAQRISGYGVLVKSAPKHPHVRIGMQIVQINGKDVSRATLAEVVKLVQRRPLEICLKSAPKGSAVEDLPPRSTPKQRFDAAKKRKRKELIASIKLKHFQAVTQRKKDLPYLRFRDEHRRKIKRCLREKFQRDKWYRKAHAYRAVLGELFRAMDVDGSGSLNKAEIFRAVVCNSTVQEIIAENAVLGKLLDPLFFHNNWHLIDTSCDGEVSVEEFEEFALFMDTQKAKNTKKRGDSEVSPLDFDEVLVSVYKTARREAEGDVPLHRHIEKALLNFQLQSGVLDFRNSMRVLRDNWKKWLCGLPSEDRSKSRVTLRAFLEFSWFCAVDNTEETLRERLQERALRELFKILDRNGDNLLNNAEIQRSIVLHAADLCFYFQVFPEFSSHLQRKKKWSVANRNIEIDTDGDGCIDFDEFVLWHRELVAKHAATVIFNSATGSAKTSSEIKPLRALLRVLAIPSKWTGWRAEHAEYIKSEVKKPRTLKTILLQASEKCARFLNDSKAPNNTISRTGFLEAVTVPKPKDDVAVKRSAVRKLFQSLDVEGTGLPTCRQVLLGLTLRRTSGLASLIRAHFPFLRDSLQPRSVFLSLSLMSGADRRVDLAGFTSWINRVHNLFTSKSQFEALFAKMELWLVGMQKSSAFQHWTTQVLRMKRAKAFHTLSKYGVFGLLRANFSQWWSQVLKVRAAVRRRVLSYKQLATLEEIWRSFFKNGTSGDRPACLIRDVMAVVNRNVKFRKFVRNADEPIAVLGRAGSKYLEEFLVPSKDQSTDEYFRRLRQRQWGRISFSQFTTAVELASQKFHALELSKRRKEAVKSMLPIVGERDELCMQARPQTLSKLRIELQKFV